MELSLEQGFIDIFRNIPFVGPVIEEIQDTCPKERLKYAIKRLIYTAAVASAAEASVVAAAKSIPIIVELGLSKNLVAAFVMVEKSGVIAAEHELSKFEQIIDEMDENTFNRFYTPIAIGLCGPFIFDHRELKKAINTALNRFKAVMKRVKRALKKASKLVFESVVAQVANSRGMTAKEVKRAIALMKIEEVKSALKKASTGVWKYVIAQEPLSRVMRNEEVKSTVAQETPKKTEEVKIIFKKPNPLASRPLLEKQRQFELQNRLRNQYKTRTPTV